MPIRRLSPCVDCRTRWCTGCTASRSPSPDGTPETAHTRRMNMQQVMEELPQTSSGVPPPAFRHHEPATLREALRKMYLVRRFEESAEQAYMRGLIHGTMHLSIGQEASAIAATLPLTDADYITSTHRGHGHCIGKGADPKRMFAEFFGKETGYCRGRGGSMHIADVSRGNLGANGIVGGGMPIAVGAALSVKKQRKDSVVMCFFGDGANNEGAFHESLNFASSSRSEERRVGKECRSRWS